ncbi:hypothetical protein ACTA71_005561 [Dictyostelium dimigraforme]
MLLIIHFILNSILIPTYLKIQVTTSTSNVNDNIFIIICNSTFNFGWTVVFGVSDVAAKLIQGEVTNSDSAIVTLPSPVPEDQHQPIDPSEIGQTPVEEPIGQPTKLSFLELFINFLTRNAVSLLISAMILDQI